MSKYFDFHEVNLIPQLGIVKSRSECDTSVKLGDFSFKLPVYPANMESIINDDLAIKLASSNYFYTMHRFMSNIGQIAFVQKMKSKNLISSISIGVNSESYDLINSLIGLQLIPDFITIDIAHGHCQAMCEMLYFLKKQEIVSYIIAGNICTSKAAKELYTWGADAIKIGIAPGFVCTTAMATRFGSRGIQPALIKQIADDIDSWMIPYEYDHIQNRIKRPTIICDGGIREHGDIAVALTMGADMVMAGSMFAGFQESPGYIIDNGDDNKLYKEYWGSASQYQSGKHNRIEGKKILIPYKDRSMLEELQSITESLQSAISYAGGTDLSAFNNVDFIINK